MLGTPIIVLADRLADVLGRPWREQPQLVAEFKVVPCIAPLTQLGWGCFFVTSHLTREMKRWLIKYLWNEEHLWITYRIKN